MLPPLWPPYTRRFLTGEQPKQGPCCGTLRGSGCRNLLRGLQPGLSSGLNDDSDRQWHAAVAYNSVDDEYLVVYENLWAGGLQDIDARRVRASDGTPLGDPSGVNIATGAGDYEIRGRFVRPRRNIYLPLVVRGPVWTAHSRTSTDRPVVVKHYDRD